VSASVALIGGRGYAGAEFLRVLAAHPSMQLAFASSGSQAGRPLVEVCPEWPEPSDTFQRVERDALKGLRADAWVLAVPNAAATSWVDAIRAARADAVIVDLSADHRFARDWVYGLPELNRPKIRSARNIANPGCYATGAQLALAPVRDWLAGTPVVFGISGYSGAGKRPSARNDPERLRNNLIPYRLNGHVHEREISLHLQADVRFIPHVAEFFRGISLTVSARLDHAMDAKDLEQLYLERYGGEKRVRLTTEVPEIRMVQRTPDVCIGGFSVDERDPRRISLVAALDNLCKGAATQAMQNLNLALDFDENLGLD